MLILLRAKVCDIVGLLEWKCIQTDPISVYVYIYIYICIKSNIYMILLINKLYIQDDN
jgi:hypothetical protein